MKRAFGFGGGGPNLGLFIGVMQFLAERGIMPTFKVVSAACIGAWIAVVYWSKDDTDVERVTHTYNWFKPVFQPKDVHDLFPIPRIFAPDFRGNAKAHFNYLVDPRNLRAAFVPAEMLRVGIDTLGFMMTPGKWLDESTRNILMHQWMGAHPLTRYLVGYEFRTAQTGGARIFYDDSRLLREVTINRLWQPDRPEIRFNAINLTAEGGPRMELFTNRVDKYDNIDMRTLCACSALPHIFAPVEVNGDIYCEGATMDTVQFINLLEDHPDLDEVWIIRIVGINQAEAPRDMTDAIANSYMIPASAMGESSIAAFRSHAAKIGWRGRIIEVPVPRLKWEWSVENLDRGVSLGREAIQGEWEIYEKGERRA
jgi:predicted acylesterase/phospholipase RssA